MDNTVIAERKLTFSSKEDSARKPLLIRIFAPTPVNPGSLLFRSDADTSSCIFEFEGIPDVKPNETFGADSIQALQLAIADVEGILKRLSGRYDFFSQLARVISRNRVPRR